MSDGENTSLRLDFDSKVCPEIRGSDPVDRVGKKTNAPEERPSIFRRAWNGWMKFAEIVGTANLVIVLSILYWTMVAIVAIPFRLASDPLRIKSNEGHGWVVRDSSSADMDSMKNQY